MCLIQLHELPRNEISKKFCCWKVAAVETATDNSLPSKVAGLKSTGEHRPRNKRQPILHFINLLIELKSLKIKKKKYRHFVFRKFFPRQIFIVLDFRNPVFVIKTQLPLIFTLFYFLLSDLNCFRKGFLN